MENLQSRLLLLTIKVLPKVDLGPLATVLSPHPLGDQEQRFKTLVPTSRTPHLPLGVDMGEPGAGKERRVGVGRPAWGPKIPHATQYDQKKKKNL